MAKKVKTKAPKKVKTKNTGRKGIVFQIQNKIGISVTLVMALVAVMCVLMVQTLVVESNEVQLQLQSEAVSLQLEKYFAPFERMVEQQAVNTEIKSIINTTGKGQSIKNNIKYGTVLNNMMDMRKLDEVNILWRCFMKLINFLLSLMCVMLFYNICYAELGTISMDDTAIYYISEDGGLYVHSDKRLKITDNVVLVDELESIDV